MSSILFISPNDSDAATLSRMLYPVSLAVEHVTRLQDARNRLNNTIFNAVLTEARLPDGNWMDVLAASIALPGRSPVIVTDSAADEHLWAEVLNIGGYDVLAQPFDPIEVQRILFSACLRSGRPGA